MIAQETHVGAEGRDFAPLCEESESEATLIERGQAILAGAYVGVATLEGSDEDTAAVYLADDGARPRPIVANRIIGRWTVCGRPMLVGRDA